MKKLWILACVASIGLTVRADSLDDEVKSFAAALKSTDTAKPGTDPMVAERMSEMSAQLVSTALAPGGDAQLEAMVRQIMATNSSDAVQKAGKALLDDLEARKKAKMEAVKTQVDAVLARAQDILMKAQKTQDLDGLLNDLQKVQASSGGNYDPDAQAQMNRVNTAYQFVAQWQDYLSARNSGNIQGAQETLRNLSNSNRQGESTLVPRSEILARIVELAGATKSPASDASTTAFPNKPPEFDEASIINGIKTLDDMESALKALRAVSNTPPYNGQTVDTQMLGQLVELYNNARNGLPVSIDLGSQNFYNGNPAPELDRVKAMVLLYLLPRYIGGGAPAPGANESVNDYLNGAMEAAAAKQDWASLQRIIEARATITKAVNTVQPMGALSFLAGLNQEIAGQYTMAVASYQNALRDPDDSLPAKIIGDRLAAIKKDHPADFAEGMKNYLSPPIAAFQTSAAIRAEMMGPAGRIPRQTSLFGTNTAPVAPTPPPPASNSEPATK